MHTAVPEDVAPPVAETTVEPAPAPEEPTSVTPAMPLTTDAAPIPAAETVALAMMAVEPAEEAAVVAAEVMPENIEAGAALTEEVLEESAVVALLDAGVSR